jgi:hypothetical protein
MFGPHGDGILEIGALDLATFISLENCRFGACLVAGQRPIFMPYLSHKLNCKS